MVPAKANATPKIENGGLLRRTCKLLTTFKSTGLLGETQVLEMAENPGRPQMPPFPSGMAGGQPGNVQPLQSQTGHSLPGGYHAQNYPGQAQGAYSAGSQQQQWAGGGGYSQDQGIYGAVQGQQPVSVETEWQIKARLWMEQKAAAEAAERAQAEEAQRRQEQERAEKGEANVIAEEDMAIEGGDIGGGPNQSANPEANQFPPQQQYDWYPGQQQQPGSQPQFWGSAQGGAEGFPNQGQDFAGQGQGVVNQGQAFPFQSQGLGPQGQGTINQGQGLPNQGPGLVSQGLNQSQGFTNQSQGLPSQTQGFPNQSQSLANQGQGFPVQGEGQLNPGQDFANQGLVNQGQGFGNQPQTEFGYQQGYQQGYPQQQFSHDPGMGQVQGFQGGGLQGYRMEGYANQGLPFGQAPNVPQFAGQFQAGGFPGGPGFAPAMGAAPYGNMGYPPGPGLPFMQPPLMQMDDGGGAGSPGAGKPKKAAVPSWLLEELRKKQAKAAAEAEDGAKAGPQKVTGPRIDGRRSPTPSDSEASDDEDAEAARKAAVNGEIRRVLTEVLLKVTDEMLVEIVTQVVEEDGADGQDDDDQDEPIKPEKAPTPARVALPKGPATGPPLPSKVPEAPVSDDDSDSDEGENPLGLAYDTDEEEERRRRKEERTLAREAARREKVAEALALGEAETAGEREESPENETGEESLERVDRLGISVEAVEHPAEEEGGVRDGEGRGEAQAQLDALGEAMAIPAVSTPVAAATGKGLDTSGEIGESAPPGVRMAGGQMGELPGGGVPGNEGANAFTETEKEEANKEEAGVAKGKETEAQETNGVEEKVDAVGALKNFGEEGKGVEEHVGQKKEKEGGEGKEKSESKKEGRTSKDEERPGRRERESKHSESDREKRRDRERHRSKDRDRSRERERGDRGGRERERGEKERDRSERRSGKDRERGEREKERHSRSDREGRSEKRRDERKEDDDKRGGEERRREHRREREEGRSSRREEDGKKRERSPEAKASRRRSPSPPRTKRSRSPVRERSKSRDRKARRHSPSKKDRRESPDERSRRRR